MKVLSLKNNTIKKERKMKVEERYEWKLPSIRRIPIVGIVQESGKWCTYQMEKAAFYKGDAVTPYEKENESDDIPKGELYIVKEVLDPYTISVDRKIPDAMNKRLWRIGS